MLRGDKVGKFRQKYRYPLGAMNCLAGHWLARQLCPGGFNRSTQHLLLLLDGRYAYGGQCTDMVHAEAEGRALGSLKERSMRGGHRAGTSIGRF
jgi:hypothetical protein